jgi:putative flippase GtrA
MALAQTRLPSRVWRKFRGKVGVRFTRFVVAAAAAFTATEVALTICNAVFHMTSTRATLIAWFAGAVVSYVLSRWAWERKGKPDVLRETIPFWVISAMVIVILTLANKLGYHSASWMHLTTAKNTPTAKSVLWVDFVWFVANVITFALRFVIFHFVLFTDRTTAARAAATGPDSVPPGTREAPAPGEVPAAAAATEAAPVSASEARAAPAAAKTAAATPAAATPAAATPSAAKSTAGTTSMGADPA